MIRSLSRASLWVLMLILFAWAVAAEGQETGGTKSCTWDASKAPSLFGFKLRMTQADVIARFPDVPELAAMLEETTYHGVMRGKVRIMEISTRKDGSKGIHVSPPYLQTRIGPQQTAGARFHDVASQWKATARDKVALLDLAPVEEPCRVHGPPGEDLWIQFIVVEETRARFLAGGCA